MSHCEMQVSRKTVKDVITNNQSLQSPKKQWIITPPHFISFSLLPSMLLVLLPEERKDSVLAAKIIL